MAVLVENFPVQEASMKSLRYVGVLFLLVLGFVLGCQKTNTSQTNPDNSAGGSAAGNERAKNAGGGSNAEARKAEEPVVIPAGTVITVRLGESLSSKTSQPGQGFAATVAQPVVVGRKTVIRDGAAAHGNVVAAKSMGHFKGGALLEVRLDSVSIEGKEHPIETSAVARSVKGKGKRSTAFIGGGGGRRGPIWGLPRGGERAPNGAKSGGAERNPGAALNRH